MEFIYILWFIIVTSILVLIALFECKASQRKRSKEIELLDAQLSILLKGALKND